MTNYERPVCEQFREKTVFCRSKNTNRNSSIRFSVSKLSFRVSKLPKVIYFWLCRHNICQFFILVRKNIRAKIGLLYFCISFKRFSKKDCEMWAFLTLKRTRKRVVCSVQASFDGSLFLEGSNIAPVMVSVIGLCYEWRASGRVAGCTCEISC